MGEFHAEDYKTSAELTESNKKGFREGKTKINDKDFKSHRGNRFLTSDFVSFLINYFFDYKNEYNIF